MSVSLGANGSNYNYPVTGDLSWGANATNFASAVSAALAKLGLGATLTGDAVINIASTTKGVLFPKMTTTQRDAIVSPSTGLLIYNTTTNRFNFYSGGWKEVIINGETNFVGLGTSLPVSALDVRNGSITLAYEASVVWGSAVYGAGTPTIAGALNAGNGYLAVFPNGSTSGETIRFAHNGRVGIGTSSPVSVLDVRNGDITLAGGASVVWGSAAYGAGTPTIAGALNAGNGYLAVFPNGSTSGETIRFAHNGRIGIGTSSPSYQLELSTDSAGKPSTNVWTITSDERIKENIELADLDICYNTVKNLPLKKYKWKYYDTNQAPDKNMLGWIAQDVQQHFPKAVNVSKFKISETESIDDCLNLNSDQINKALYGAVQKMQTLIETQQAKILELENRINTLEGN